MTHHHPRADPVVPMRAVADELGVHVTTVKRYADAGLLRLWRVGPRKLGVRRSEIERFLAANQPHPNAGPNQPEADAPAGAPRAC